MGRNYLRVVLLDDNPLAVSWCWTFDQCRSNSWMAREMFDVMIFSRYHLIPCEDQFFRDFLISWIVRINDT